MPLEQDARAEAADPSASLLVVRLDLSLLTLAPFQPDVISAVAIGDGRAPSAVVERFGRGGFRVERLLGAGPDRVTLRTSDYSAEALFSRGEMLLVHEVTFDPKAHFLSSPGQRAAVSVDRGKTWRTIDLTSERASTVCLADSGFWVLSAPPDVRLRFHALRVE